MKQISFLYPEVEALTDETGQVLFLVNQFRQQNGLGPLAVNPELQASAQAYAVVLATQAEFSHTVGGTTTVSRAQAKGFRGGFVGENIARGYIDANDVVIAWENSPGHRANLLSPTWGIIGIGVADGPEGRSFVQDFSAPIDGGVPPPSPAPPPAETFSLIGKYTFWIGSLGNYVLSPIK